MTTREPEEGDAFEVDLAAYRFDADGVRAALAQLAGRHAWPLVYLLSDARQAYVGETANVRLRLDAHLRHPDKGQLRDLRLVTSRQFNKSAALHLEAKLISYLSGDGKLDLLNRSPGRVDHDYYQQDRYDALFEDLWERLRREQVAEQTLEQIDNSDLFKFSPYKSLSPDQYTAVARIVDHLSTGEEVPLVVRGAAGTGKTVLAIFLMKLLASDVAQLLDTDGEVYDDSDGFDLTVLRRLKQALPNPRVGLVVAMTSLRNTLREVFGQLYGLSAKQVLSPSEASKADPPFDVLLVDEAHRLRRRKAIGWMGAYDATNRRLGLPKEATELDWVLGSAPHVVLFYDKAQSVRPSDVNAERFATLLAASPVIDLQTQHRSRGGVAFTRFVRELLDDSWSVRTPFDAKEGFELLMFEDFGAMVDRIKARDQEIGLSRVVAGFAWPWASKTDKSAIDITIDGVGMQWNMTADKWINSPTAVNEVGCIHTTQGYDLNYVGVVFGPEIGYDPVAERIVVYRDRYFDTKGKQGVRSEEQLAAYIKQVYYTILCRGIRGVYVYVCDAHLREHLCGFFQPASTSDVVEDCRLELSRTLDFLLPREAVHPYVDAVPFYDIAVAAGDFSEAQVAEEPEGWIRVPQRTSISPDFFACRVHGESMNRYISSGALVLFRRGLAGSRQGKIVLASHRRFEESEFGAGLTVKRYRSEKVPADDGSWRHGKIRLEPESLDSSFRAIELEEREADELRILAEFVEVIETPS